MTTDAASTHSSPTPSFDYESLTMIESWAGAWQEPPVRDAAARPRRDQDDTLPYDDYGWDESSMIITDVRASAGSHAVLLYEHDAPLERAIERFISEGLDAEEQIILALTPDRVASLRGGAVGDRLAAAERTGRVSITDARTALVQIVHDGVLDAERFEQLFASAVRQRRERGPLRVYGQIVTLLWEQGDVVAALGLERLWNDLQREVAIDVLCSYPLSLVPEESDGCQAVRACHTEAHVLTCD